MGVRLVVRPGQGGDQTEAFAYSFSQERVLVGRSAGADVRIPHATISSEHALFRHLDSKWVVEDKGSTNGTWVNGTRIPTGRPKVVNNGDEIRLGKFVLTFSVVAVSESTSADQTRELARQLLRQNLAGNSMHRAALVFLNGNEAGRRLRIPEGPARLLLGRGEDCDVKLDDSEASREHMELVVDQSGPMVVDCGSKNGIVVNDKPTQERRLRHGDEILVGSTLLLFDEPADAALKASTELPDESAPPPDLAHSFAPAPAGLGDSPERPDDLAASEKSGQRMSTTGRGLTTPRTQSRPPTQRKGRAGADLIIYLMAAGVLALSIAGLMMLLRSG